MYFNNAAAKAPRKCMWSTPMLCLFFSYKISHLGFNFFFSFFFKFLAHIAGNFPEISMCDRLV